MYENVNKLHPYIEKELEGIETYDRVILYGRAGRSMAIERPFILDVFGGSDNWVFDPHGHQLSAVLNQNTQGERSRFEWQQYLFNHYGALEAL